MLLLYSISLVAQVLRACYIFTVTRHKTSMFWTNALDWFSDRKPSEHGKCKVEGIIGFNSNEVMGLINIHLTLGAVWVIFW